MKRIIKKFNRFFAAFLAVCLLSAALPGEALAADYVIYYVGERGYFTVNRFNGAIENSTEDISGNMVIPEMVEGVEVRSIADGAFFGRDGLVSVTVPSSVSKIGARAFSGCVSLQSVKLDEGVTELGANAFANCYVLTSVSLPATLRALPDYAFASCLDLKSITVPSGVSSVGNYAFHNCKNLTTVSLPAGVSTIGEYAFSKCTALKSIVLPTQLQAMSTALFSECTALSQVTLSGNVKTIGQNAFGKCTALEKLILPEGVQKVENWAFNGCENLKILSMPDSVTSIAPDSFYGCDQITFYVNPASYSQVFASANQIPIVQGTLDNDHPDPDTYPETPFADVKGHWAKSEIEWAYAKKYFNGATDTAFLPDQPLNRGMLVAVLYRMEGSPAVGSSGFSDVSDGAYYAKAVAWAKDTGVVNGVGDNKFAPARNIKRQELATMLHRYAQYKKLDTSARGDMTQFKDVNEIGSFAGTAMTWAVGAKVMNGVSGGKLDPAGQATRAQAVVMLKRFSELK